MLVGTRVGNAVSVDKFGEFCVEFS